MAVEQSKAKHLGVAGLDKEGLVGRGEDKKVDQRTGEHEGEREDEWIIIRGRGNMMWICSERDECCQLASEARVSEITVGSHRSHRERGSA